MTHVINDKLRKSAEASALKSSTMPIFLCDDNFKLCMYSDSLAHLESGFILGKDISGVFSESERLKISNMQDGCLPIEINLPNYKGGCLAVSGHLDELRYIAVILDGNTYSRSFDASPYLSETAMQISTAVNDLLHSPKLKASRLSLLCAKLNRLTRYSLLACSPTELNQFTELIPYINAIVSEFSPKLASVGSTIRAAKSIPHVYFAKCPPIILGSVLSTLISAAVCLSSDGNISITCSDNPLDFTSAIISVTVASPSQTNLPNALSLLAERFDMLRLDLLAVNDMAGKHNVDISCRYGNDNSYSIELSLALARAGNVVLHSPSYSIENVFLRVLVEQLFTLVELEGTGNAAKE